jgi:hypothetical protein
MLVRHVKLTVGVALVDPVAVAGVNRGGITRLSVAAALSEGNCLCGSLLTRQCSLPVFISALWCQFFQHYGVTFKALHALL